MWASVRLTQATLYPGKNNVYLGPNNVGQTAVLKALNLLLSPELGTRGLVDRTISTAASTGSARDTTTRRPTRIRRTSPSP